MSEFPVQGQTPYGAALKAYIDQGTAGRGDQSTDWVDLGAIDGAGTPGVLYGRRTGPWVTLVLNPGFTAALTGAFEFLGNGFVLPNGYRPTTVPSADNGDLSVSESMALVTDDGSLVTDCWVTFQKQGTACFARTPYISGSLTFRTDDALPSVIS